MSDGDILTAGSYTKGSWGGNGTDGTMTCTNGSIALFGGSVYQYATFNLAGGSVCHSTGGFGSPIYVKVAGDLTIAGNINMAGSGFAASTGLDSTPGNSAGTYYERFAPPGGAGQGGTADHDGNPGRGATRPNDAITSQIPGMPLFFGGRVIFCGTGGGDGGVDNTNDGGGGGGGCGMGTDGDGGTGGNLGGAGGTSDGTPGAGGGTIVFEVGGDVSLTGSIVVNGTDASAPSDGGGAGGGGGGSFLCGYLGDLTDTSYSNVAGGYGATGAGGGTYLGGNGGDGLKHVEKVYW